MDIAVFKANQLDIVFRVLRTALRPVLPLTPVERTFLATYARIAGCATPPADPRTIDPLDVFIEGAHQRKRLVQLAAIAALLSRPVNPASVAFVRALAQRLESRDSVIDALVKGRHLRVRLLALGRGMRAMLKEAYLSEGPSGVLRFVAALLFKASVNRDKLSNYKRLGLLPEGTLGREYWKHMTEQGFGFPGEPGGIAESAAYHDVAHVLAEHAATPLGEIQQGSFQGGNRREDGFFFVQFVLLHFHHGVRITPTAPPDVGNFDPAVVLWAIHRGAQCRVDMTHQWDFWPLLALPLAEARRRCGLLPKLPALALAG